MINYGSKEERNFAIQQVPLKTDRIAEIFAANNKIFNDNFNIIYKDQVYVLLNNQPVLHLYITVSLSRLLVHSFCYKNFKL